MGGPEEALHQILAVASSVALAIPGGLVEGIRFLRAGDISEVCRRVVLQRSGPCAPRCVFGDLTSRCPPQLFRRAMRLAAVYKGKAVQAMQAGRARQEAIRTHGLKFLAKACLFMLDITGAQPLPGYCYRHSKHCCAWFDRPFNFGGLTGCIAGINCYDWSSMGGADGWMGRSAVIFLCFLREVLLYAYDWLILECTGLFDESGLVPLHPWYKVVTLKFSPTLLGFPCSRIRKYMLLTRHGVLKWRRQILDVGHMQAFKMIFSRRVQLGGVDMARAPAHMVENYKMQLCEARGLPPLRSSGRPWSFFQLMPKSIRVAIEQYEQMASLRHGVRPRLVCNVRQRPSYMDPTDMVPALLRRSLLWSLSARRPLLSEEHVEIMGYSMFDPRPCAIADVLRSLTDGERRSVCGNGMHVGAIGASLMFLLSGVERE